ncbi:MAG: energy transducer TonB [Gammaproteobacteria bacterium]
MYAPSTRRLSLRSLVALAFTTSASLYASTAQAADAPVVVQPAPVSQEGRFFPGFGNEGFVITRFTVKADGTTDDIEVVGGFTNPFWERPISEAVEKWTYTPGTVNGQPADFLNQEYIFRPKIAPTLASSPDFQEEYKKLDEQVQAGEIDAAIRRLDGTFREHIHTVLDYAVAQYTLSRLHLQKGDPFAALAAVQKTTMSSLNEAGEVEYMLTPDLLEGALRQQLVLSSGIHQEGEVLRTWELLDALYDIPADDKLHELVTAARAKIESTDPLPALAKILDGEKFVSYRPVHRIFTVTDVMGELKTITARCEHRNLELDYQDGVDWTLPPALGACVLDFAGDDNTTFTIYEFRE